MYRHREVGAAGRRGRSRQGHEVQAPPPYAGWPVVEQHIGERAIEQISFSPWKNTTGSIDILVDNVRLVPEPTTLALLGLGCVVLPTCRRRA